MRGSSTVNESRLMLFRLHCHITDNDSETPSEFAELRLYGRRGEPLQHYALRVEAGKLAAAVAHFESNPMVGSVATYIEKHRVMRAFDYPGARMGLRRHFRDLEALEAGREPPLPTIEKLGTRAVIWCDKTTIYVRNGPQLGRPLGGFTPVDAGELEFGCPSLLYTRTPRITCTNQKICFP